MSCQAVSFQGIWSGKDPPEHAHAPRLFCRASAGENSGVCGAAQSSSVCPADLTSLRQEKKKAEGCPAGMSRIALCWQLGGIKACIPWCAVLGTLSPSAPGATGAAPWSHCSQHSTPAHISLEAEASGSKDNMRACVKWGLITMGTDVRKKRFFAPSQYTETGCLFSLSSLMMFFKYNWKHFKYNSKTLCDSFACCLCSCTLGYHHSRVFWA